MAIENVRSHVSGFVKQFKEHVNHNTVTFSVTGQKFILPKASTFANLVILARKSEVNVLLTFEKTQKVHPTVTGVVIKPSWAQIKTASEG